MCNLFIPLCPIGLHATAYPDGANLPGDLTDAQILWVYLCKSPAKECAVLKGPKHSKATLEAWLNQPKSTRQAWEKAKLYDRITWHTCPCFFKGVSILHPLEGHGRPAYRPSLPTCTRCTAAAKSLRMERMGGLAVPRFVTTPEYDRCTFDGNGLLIKSAGPHNGQNERNRIQSKPVLRERSTYEASGGNGGGGDRHGMLVSTRSDGTRESALPSQPRTSNYQRDLDSYLAETYGPGGLHNKKPL